MSNTNRFKRAPRRELADLWPREGQSARQLTLEKLLLADRHLQRIMEHGQALLTTLQTLDDTSIDGNEFSAVYAARYKTFSDLLIPLIHNTPSVIVLYQWMANVLRELREIEVALSTVDLGEKRWPRNGRTVQSELLERVREAYDLLFGTFNKIRAIHQEISVIEHDLQRFTSLSPKMQQLKIVHAETIIHAILHTTPLLTDAIRDMTDAMYMIVDSHSIFALVQQL